MKKKNKFKIIKTIFLIALGIFVGAKILNSKEKKDKEYTNSKTNRKLSYKATFYEKVIKRMLDIVLASIGLVVTAPIVLVAAVLIFIEDPGRVIFTQKRVGINKSYFKIHKLRSMKHNTGDVPTHLLSKEEQDKLILKVGRFIRKTSIDEFVQFVDIIRGRMSLVGPRPALWNQYDLIEERDKYKANDVRPGLTGWAQINGRDELPIPEKAKLDGEYCKALRKSSLSGFIMDVRCVLGTFEAVLFSKGVVEGGTGTMKSQLKDRYRHYTDDKSDEELIGHIGFGEKVETDKKAHKKVLVTGAGSYIGRSFIEYAKKHYKENFDIEELDMLEDNWSQKDFSGYDIVYHVAGIAHADVGNVDETIKLKYYQVNTDLAIDVAKKAKKEGVREFIFMSSMIVYGDSAPFGQTKLITFDTVPNPSNFYGDSKLQADVAVRELADESFKVIVLRPPMIYGRGSKGNYPTLAKLSKILPVFPNVDNERSMIYIENLCEFLCQIMLVEKINRNETVLIPQNAEWTVTSEMTEMIARANGKNTIALSILKPCVVIGGKMPGKIGGLVNKAFGNSCYDKAISRYEGIDYQKVGLEESVIRSEKNEL